MNISYKNSYEKALQNKIILLRVLSKMSKKDATILAKKLVKR